MVYLILRDCATLGMNSNEFLDRRVANRAGVGTVFSRGIGTLGREPSVLHAFWNRVESRMWLKEAFFKETRAWCPEPSRFVKAFVPRET